MARRSLSASLPEVRAEMARQRLTQREFARRLGVIDMWLSRRLKAVQPLNLDELDRLADALGVSAIELLRRANESRTLPRRVLIVTRTAPRASTPGSCTVSAHG